ncbi:MAG: endonuclease/exonuclease/phosphatase family protein [Planctomycetes bacterium]|nr:endonuclease/exonuclease/phosphatase family protein [Planctomycetota bacterium]MCB9891802.1 endonuclease/exonuclease/phosphatase family protein [Planctomycetota bacterium]
MTKETPDDVTRESSSMRDILAPRVRPVGLIHAVVLLAGIGTLLGFFGELAWWLELAAHFRPHMLVVLLAASIAPVLRKRYRLALSAWALALVNLVPLWPHVFAPVEDVAHVGKTWTACLANVNTMRGDPEAVERHLRALDADLVVLEEVGSRWANTLRRLEDLYPHREFVLRDDNFGIALLSRHPFESVTVESLGEARLPSIFARLVLDGRTIAILGTHPLPPMNALYTRLHNEQLDRVREFASRVDEPLLVLGDLNTTPWAPSFGRILEGSGLRNAGRGRWLPTWPSPLGFAGLPLDHCLIREGIVVTQLETGEPVGSDHRPLHVTFGVIGGTPE